MVLAGKIQKTEVSLINVKMRIGGSVISDDKELTMNYIDYKQT